MAKFSHAILAIMSDDDISNSMVK